MPTRLRMILPILLSLLAGSILILADGKNPLTTYLNLFDAGFSCQPGPGRCALLTTLQFATPLVLNGLSALIAMRGGYLSIGQYGQMLFGALAASWIGSQIQLPVYIHPAFALLGAALIGGLWGLIPGLLKHFLGVSEIISTLLLNPIAGVLVGLSRMPGIMNSAKLEPLISSTKLSAGIFLAIGMILVVFFYLFRTTQGLEIRTTADAPRFSVFGGMPKHRSALLPMVLSGAMAGLAGGVEVLGVHYHFISSFSAVNEFDGLIIALAGHLHPFGVLLFAILVGGLRAGAIVGLQIRSGVPRELGGALVAMMLIFIATIQITKKRQSSDGL